MDWLLKNWLENLIIYVFHSPILSDYPFWAIDSVETYLAYTSTDFEVEIHNFVGAEYCWENDF